MRKKASVSLILIVLLVAILAMALVACNRTPTSVNDLPEDLGGQGANGTVQKSVPAYLKFYFPLPNSVFQSMFIDEFNIEDVEFSVIYVNDIGEVVSEVPLGHVTEEMVREEDRPKLKQPGHHEISISTTLSSGDEVSGTTKIHLKDRSGKIERVKITVDLKGGYTTNGELDDQDPHETAVVSIDKGYQFDSWDELVNVLRLSKADSALSSLQVIRTDGTEVKLSDGEGFPFAFDEDCTLRAGWTENIIKVTFHLNAPLDSEGKLPELREGATDPSSLFEKDGKYCSDEYCNVEKTVGRIKKPTTDDFNVFVAIYFAGWYTRTEKEGGGYEYTAWNFSTSVGTEDIDLYAQWTERLYSYTIYSMGGAFRQDVEPVSDAEASGNTRITAAVAYSAKGDSVLNRITFTGFIYNKNYDEYIADVNIGSKTVTLRFSDFCSADGLNKLFDKGTEILQADGLYDDYVCKDKVTVSGSVRADGVAYVGWTMKSKEDYSSGTEDYEKALSDYTLGYVFKDGYTVKTDGSVSLDKISGEAVNDIIIPKRVYDDGQWRDVTEIGARACLNAKALTTVTLLDPEDNDDFKLTTIGEQAFAHCVNLEDVVGLTDITSVTSVGTNAFEDTIFEDDYSKNHYGAQFIVISKTIYKYVGADVDVLDLSTDSYYSTENMHDADGNTRDGYSRRLFEATNIMSGAFGNCTKLARVMLSANIERIDNGAFSNLGNLLALVMADDSRISYIGESAFNDNFLSEKNTYNLRGEEGSHAIYIGHILYRMIDKGATSFEVPASVTRELSVEGGESVSHTFNITSIAANAFVGCTKLSDITFEKETNITVIGKDAFLDTPYIQTRENGFTVVNGILAAFYGARNNIDVVLPQTCSIEVSEYAFNNYATNIRSIQFGSNVSSIANNAFNGASSLSALIFPNIEVAEDGVNLTDAPMVEGTSFDNNHGVPNENLQFFMRESVIKFFNDVESGVIKIGDDPATNAWYNLYFNNKAMFVAEKLQYVRVDSTKVANKLLRTGNESDAFRDMYGDKEIEGALEVMSNSGVRRYESLSADGNSVYLAQKEGTNIYVLHYTYQEQEFGGGGERDPYPFEIAVYDYWDPIEDKAFHSSDYYAPREDSSAISASALRAGGTTTYPFWIEGLEGNVTEGVRGAYPTFWSSTDVNDLKLKFHYKDYNEGLHEFDVDIAKYVDGLSFTDDNGGRNKVAHITVDFYGIGEYEIEFVYLVVVPKFDKIEQVSAFTMPLNANGNTYRAGFNIRMTRQDGSVVMMPATAANGFNISQVDSDVNTHSLITNTLGFHAATFVYTDRTLATGDLDVTVVYSVVLQEDPSLFTFEILSEREKTAKITATSLKGSNIRTVVIPSAYTVGEVSYKVVQIGEKNGTEQTGVFAGLTNLTTVYLSSNIQVIGSYTFAGCTNLRNVYTSQETTTEGKSNLTAGNFDKVGKESVDVVDGKPVYEVVLKSLPDDPNETYETVSEGGVNHYVFTLEAEYEFDGEIYRVIGLKSEMTMPAPSENGKQVFMYLPNSIYLQTITYDNNGKPIPQYGGESGSSSTFVAIAYDSNSAYRSRVYSRLNSGLADIGTLAFANCTSLTSVNFSASTRLKIVGDSAFSGSGLTSVDLGSNTNLDALGAAVFSDCTSLVSVNLPTSLTAIGDYAFNGCTALTTLNMGGAAFGTTTTNQIAGFTIGVRAFGRCTSLREIHLWSGIKNVGSRAFNTCYALTVYCNFTETAKPTTWSADWDECGDDITPQKEKVPVVYAAEAGKFNEGGVATDGLVYFVDANGIRYALNSAEGTATVVRQSSSWTSIEIPATVSVGETKYDVTAIGDYAFKGQTNLVSVIIHSKKLRYIGESAFMDCVNLSEFRFVDEASESGEEFEIEFKRENVAIDAFQGCDRLPDAQHPKIKQAASDEP